MRGKIKQARVKQANILKSRKLTSLSHVSKKVPLQEESINSRMDLNITSQSLTGSPSELTRLRIIAAGNH
jgi:hypothetical protein